MSDNNSVSGNHHYTERNLSVDVERIGGRSTESVEIEPVNKNDHSHQAVCTSVLIEI